MTPSAVHQFVSSFVPRDAVSMHALEVRKLLRDMGLHSEIFVKESRAEMVPEGHFYRAFQASAGTVLLYQAATGSGVADFLMERPEPLVVNYHNLTPPEFFAAWEPHTAVELDVGRRQLADLAGRTDLGIAVSAFNENDLRGWGYRHTTVAPVLVDPDALRRQADPSALQQYRRRRRGSSPVVLFVGRLAPNKAQHDLIKALAAYHRLYDPGARLHLVGAPSSGRYQRALRGLVGAIGLDDSVDVPGSVTDGELAAAYEAADLFVSLSDHEGFCVPLLEAMHHRLPIVAYAAGAVPETLGDAGLLLPDKDPVVVAAAIHRVATDGALRDRLVAAGDRRLADFAIERTRERFRQAIEPALAAVPA